MPNIFKRALVNAAATEAVLGNLRRRVAGSGVTVFMYHDVGADDAVDDAWAIVRRGDFSAHVEYLREYYDIVDLDTAFSSVRSAEPLGRPQAVLTFDDGLRGNHEHLLPLVDTLRVPVTIYVATGHIESQQGYWFDRVVNALQPGFDGSIDLTTFGIGSFEISGAPGARRWSKVQRILSASKALDEASCVAVAETVEAQSSTAGCTPVLAPLTVGMLSELARHPLITLGAHTHGHELLPLLAPDQVRRSVQACLERLERWAGVRANHFAYPSGQCNAACRSVIADLGFTTAVSTEPGVWTSASDALSIPRVSVGRYDDLSTFRLNAVGGLGRVLAGSHRSLLDN